MGLCTFVLMFLCVEYNLMYKYKYSEDNLFRNYIYVYMYVCVCMYVRMYVYFSLYSTYKVSNLNISNTSFVSNDTKKYRRNIFV